MAPRHTSPLPGRIAVLGALFVAATGAAMTLRPAGGETLFTTRHPPAGRTGSPSTSVPPESPTVKQAPPSTGGAAPSAPSTAPPMIPPAVADDRRFTLTPVSGPNRSRVVARGGGCDGAGVSVELFDPSGRHYTTDGGPTLPDGTWWLELVITAAAAADYLGGEYTVQAACRVDTSVLFDYEPQTFVMLR